jgi:hypothetical protein
MTILRYAPGDSAPSAGMYALVGHFGEKAGVAIWRDQGTKLPFAVAMEDIAPLWYIKVGEELPVSRAA